MLLLAVTLLLSCRLVPAAAVKHVDMPCFVADEVAITMVEQESMQINPEPLWDLGFRVETPNPKPSTLNPKT